MTNTESSLRAEESLIGAILENGKQMERIPASLRIKDFESETCRYIFKIARSLYRDGTPVDHITVMNQSARTKHPLTEDTLVRLMLGASSNAPIEEYARIVHENGFRRQTQLAALRIAQDESSSVEELSAQLAQLNRELEYNDENLLGQLSEVEFEPPRWLIEPYFPRGKGTLVQAEPGTGKTALMCAIAAAVTSAKPVLGIRIETPGDVLMISTEDDLSTLRGRVEANGGDPCRVHFLRKTDGLTLDSPILDQAIRQSYARLVILDPFQAFLGSNVDMHRANETRPILTKLIDMCNEHDCACVIVAHLGKSTLGKSPVTQSLGSVDIPAAMRSIIHIVRNPQCEGELLAYHVKSSNAPLGKTIAYTIGDRGGVMFTGFSDLKLSELDKQEEEEPYDDYDTDPLVRVFRQMMTDYPKGGFWSYDDVRDACTHILGFCSFDSGRKLRAHIDRPDFLRKLIERDGIRLTVGDVYNNKRGIRLEPYTAPYGTQTQLTGV